MITNFNELNHQRFMEEALKEAKEAGERGDRPIGSVIVHNGKIIARGSNRSNTLNSNIAHAETTAIHNCAPYLMQNAEECVLYTTVEPCIMCLSTIVMANIRNVVFAIEDNYMNMEHFIHSNPYIKARLHHYVGGMLRDDSAEIIKAYSSFMAEVVIKGRKPTCKK
jgi:tRNA(adenine34) deaminase